MRGAAKVHIVCTLSLLIYSNQQTWVVYGGVEAYNFFQTLVIAYGTDFTLRLTECNFT